MSHGFYQFGLFTEPLPLYVNLFVLSLSKEASSLKHCFVFANNR